MLQIEKRNIAVTILLSIVTCGIYGIIWGIKMGKEAVSVKDQNDAGTVEILLILFFPFIGFYLAEKKFAEGCQMRGIMHKDNSTLYLILGIVGLGIVDYALMQADLNGLVDNGYAVDPKMGPVPGGQYQQPPYQNPQQPQYQAPQYQQPQQPQYQQPQQPQYQSPQYQPPQQPQYQPPQQPQYQPPQYQPPQDPDFPQQQD